MRLQELFGFGKHKTPAPTENQKPLQNLKIRAKQIKVGNTILQYDKEGQKFRAIVWSTDTMANGLIKIRTDDGSANFYDPDEGVVIVKQPEDITQRIGTIA